MNHRTDCVVSPQVFPLLRSVSWMMVAMATFGMGIGIPMSLYNLVMVNFMGLENLAPVFGAAGFTLAVGFTTVGPLIGKFPSESCTFIYCFHYECFPRHLKGVVDYSRCRSLGNNH